GATHSRLPRVNRVIRSTGSTAPRDRSSLPGTTAAFPALTAGTIARLVSACCWLGNPIRAWHDAEITVRAVGVFLAETPSQKIVRHVGDGAQPVDPAEPFLQPFSAQPVAHLRMRLHGLDL